MQQTHMVERLFQNHWKHHAIPWNDENGVTTIRIGHNKNRRVSSGQKNRRSHYSRLMDVLTFGEHQHKPVIFIDCVFFLLLSMMFKYQWCCGARCLTVVSAHLLSCMDGLQYRFLSVFWSTIFIHWGNLCSLILELRSKVIMRPFTLLELSDNGLINNVMNCNTSCDPPQFPDLNTIEPLCGIFEDKLWSRFPPPKARSELETFMQEGWLLYVSLLRRLLCITCICPSLDVYPSCN